MLDEATSALDGATEAAIQATLERLRRGRTVITVTHRLNAAERADRILVLDRGEVCEDGTHQELMARGGVYNNLWAKQHGFVLDAAHHRAGISIERLRLVPAFYGMPEEVLTEAVSLFRTEEVPERRTVVCQGDAGSRFYIIVRGSVEMLRATGEGDPRPDGVLQDGDCFGLAAWSEGETETETVRTLYPCVFLTLTVADVDRLKESVQRRGERSSTAGGPLSS